MKKGIRLVTMKKGIRLEGKPVIQQSTVVLFSFTFI